VERLILLAFKTENKVVHATVQKDRNESSWVMFFSRMAQCGMSKANF
jgi:hypothetical protein